MADMIPAQQPGISVPASLRRRVLGIVLAGGKGTRLYPLTRERAKPAVPFGGKYRIIDFVLSNFINSGIYSIYVLTQFRSQSLLQHLSEGWQFGGLLKSQFIIPFRRRCAPRTKPGIRARPTPFFRTSTWWSSPIPHVVAIFGGDHIYRMNVASMIDFHMAEAGRGHRRRHSRSRGSRPREFGVIEVDDDGRILAFHEKKPDAPTMPGDSEPRLRLHGQLHFLHPHPSGPAA